MANVGDFGYIELPAPAAWRKLFYPGNVGTPRKPSVVFLAPGGEEIKSKRQLKNYLTENPENPDITEFDWTTGETPRRSSRLSQKTKATLTPNGEPSPKKLRRSSRGKEHANEVVNDTEEAKHAKEVVAEDTGKDKQRGTEEVAESNHDADKDKQTWKEEVGENSHDSTQQVEGVKKDAWKEETGENDPEPEEKEGNVEAVKTVPVNVEMSEKGEDVVGDAESQKGTETSVKEETEAAPTGEKDVKTETYSDTYYEIKSESE